MSEHVTEHQSLCLRSVKHPRVTSLADVLKQCCLDQYLRRTILVKVLHTRHDRLYVLDTSLGPGSPGYVVVMLKSLCYMPMEVIHGQSMVIILQDVQCHKGSLLADKYTQISLVKDIHDVITLLDKDALTSLQSLRPAIPPLELSSTDNEIITLTGNVVGVDEATAFAWPSCALCNNELLAELPDRRYFCNKCGATVPTVTNMSLAVYVTSLLLPLHCSIKVQLAQETILGLLTASISTVEGYDLTSLLGQEIGPLLCLVVQTRTCEDDNTGFLLEQLPGIQ